MATTSSATYSSTIRTYYEKKLVDTAGGYLVADRFANHKMIGRGEGNTVRVNRILRPELQITASTAGTLVTDGDAKALTSNYAEFTQEIWGDSFSFDEDVDVNSFIMDSDNRDTIARQMAQSLDKQVMRKICGITGGMRYRTDATASSYQRAGAQTGNTSSTTAFYSTTLTAADDYWNGGFLTVTNPSGNNYDITRQVSDFIQAAPNTVTVAAFPQAFGTSASTQLAKAWVCVGTGLTSTDHDIDVTGLLKVAAVHEHLQTEKYSGGVYHCFLPSAVHLALQQDTTWINSVVYDESFHLGTYRLGRIFDIEFLTTSQPYRESTAGVEDMASGAVYVTPIFGANSHSVFTFANPGGSGNFGVKFYYVDNPDSKNLRMSKRFISWKGMWAGGVTRATSVIGWMNAPSSVGMLI